MSRQIPESDWKHFRKVHAMALDRYCQRVLGEVGALTEDTSKSAHERYLALYQLVRRRDKELAGAFDDTRRSTAFFQLAIIANLGLLTEEELAPFGPETREVLTLLWNEKT